MSDVKLEVVVVPVTDADRAKEFYGRLGWRLDVDVDAGDYRVIQYTPPGSACSVQFGRNITSAAPGSAKGMHLVVDDIQAAHDDLVARGVEATGVYHCTTGFTCRYADVADVVQHADTGGRVSGAAPDHQTYASFASFTDPDGNGWIFQEVTARLPGRVDATTTSFASASDLAAAFRRAAAAHGEHEARTGRADPDWPDWYAAYMVAEQAGTELPT